MDTLKRFPVVSGPVDGGTQERPISLGIGTLAGIQIERVQTASSVQNRHVPRSENAELSRPNAAFLELLGRKPRVFLAAIAKQRIEVGRLASRDFRRGRDSGRPANELARDRSAGIMPQRHHAVLIVIVAGRIF